MTTLTPAAPKQLLKIADLSSKLAISRTTLWRLRRNHPDFPEPIPVAGLLMYEESEIDEWISRQRDRAD